MIPGKSPSSVESLEPLIKAYAQSQAELQMVQTRSGDLWTGGLNEPKYHVNGTRFDGEWGRPQR
jgi:glucoamylase